MPGRPEGQRCIPWGCSGSATEAGASVTQSCCQGDMAQPCVGQRTQEWVSLFGKPPSASSIRWLWRGSIISAGVFPGKSLCLIQVIPQEK